MNSFGGKLFGGVIFALAAAGCGAVSSHGAIGDAVVSATPTPGSTDPSVVDAKASIAARDDYRRSHPAGTPNPSPYIPNNYTQPSFALGIINSGEAPASSTEFDGINTWHGQNGASDIIVVAGSAGLNSALSAVFFWQITGATSTHQIIQDTAVTGPLQITGASGNTLTLTGSTGQTVTFNANTQAFGG